jgi:hypothetical protein
MLAEFVKLLNNHGRMNKNAKSVYLKEKKNNTALLRLPVVCG